MEVVGSSCDLLILVSGLDFGIAPVWQAVFAMLACARLGAVHSVVFGGFAGPLGPDPVGKFGEWPGMGCAAGAVE